MSRSPRLPSQRRFRASDLGLLLLALVVMALVVVVGTRDVGPTAQQRQASAVAEQQAADRRAEIARINAERPVVAYLGDSFTGGSEMNSGPETTWARMLTRQMSWAARYSAVGGSGYVAGGPEEKPFPSRVAEIVASKADIVIVAGGINDPVDGSVAAASAAVLSEIRAGLPAARIIVFGPFFPQDRPASYVGTTAAIQQAAAAVRADYIDPGTWFAGDRGRGGAQSLIGSDGTHPTDAGHAYILERVRAEFARLGIKPYPHPLGIA